MDWCTDVDKMIGYLPSNLYPELKWGDEPIEVFLFTKEFVQSFGDACYEQGNKEEGNLLIDDFIKKK